MVLVAVFAAFIAHSALHMDPSVVALLGGGILVVLSRLEHSDYLSSVEWDTLLFFAGLFIMVGALVKTGVVKQLARVAVTATGGNTLIATMVILAASLLISGVVNNVPYAATMAPVVADLAPALVDHNPSVLWWALALGTDFGGNLTAVGASANVVILGIAGRADSPISFWEFTRKAHGGSHRCGLLLRACCPASTLGLDATTRDRADGASGSAVRRIRRGG